MDLFGRLSLAFIGIGAVEPSELLARSAGNVFSSPGNGDVVRGRRGRRDFLPLLRHRTGKPVETPLNDRVIGLSLEELARPSTASWRSPAANRRREAIAGALKTRRHRRACHRQVHRPAHGLTA
jgi:DNA-binding transcriptional regulator LsrR (DeoR family)